MTILPRDPRNQTPTEDPYWKAKQKGKSQQQQEWEDWAKSTGKDQATLDRWADENRRRAPRKDPMADLTRIAGSAMDDLAAMATGEEQDKDLKLYSSLQEQDFDDMRKRYGFDKTAEYIKVMEAKRMGVK